MVCAATSEPEEGDTYIDDRLHYQLSVVSRAVVADVEHEGNGLWHWVHGDGFEGATGFLRAQPEMR